MYNFDHLLFCFRCEDDVTKLGGAEKCAIGIWILEKLNTRFKGVSEMLSGCNRMTKMHYVDGCTECQSVM